MPRISTGYQHRFGCLEDAGTRGIRRANVSSVIVFLLHNPDAQSNVWVTPPDARCAVFSTASGIAGTLVAPAALKSMTARAFCRLRR